ncbi:MAG: DUF4215 domain-containing protein [Sandaracinaceae bacterium]|nr:DUF4215 domain-containing protein [Sandaracinaceae bacterium]
MDAGPGLDAGPDAEPAPIVDAGPDAARPDGAVSPDAGPPRDGGPTTICGDRVVEPGEACDDGFTTACGPCNATCTGPGTGATCGDRVICPDVEVCDDGNGVGGDGCDATCAIEPGWSCAGTPSVCTNTCGNGALDGSELCDDGNNRAGDGCDAFCRLELGWACSGTTCRPVCGDGLVVGAETCDDGNTDACGTCNATCSGPGTVPCPEGQSCTTGRDCVTGACRDGNCRPCTPESCDPTLPYCDYNCSVCDPATHVGCGGALSYCTIREPRRYHCVECVEGRNCPRAQPICDANRCRACTTSSECSDARQCCAGECMFFDSVEHCGGCGIRCAGGQVCTFGVCT